MLSECTFRAPFGSAVKTNDESATAASSAMRQDERKAETLFILA